MLDGSTLHNWSATATPLAHMYLLLAAKAKWYHMAACAGMRAALIAYGHHWPEQMAPLVRNDSLKCEPRIKTNPRVSKEWLAEPGPDSHPIPALSNIPGNHPTVILCTTLYGRFSPECNRMAGYVAAQTLSILSTVAYQLIHAGCVDPRAIPAIGINGLISTGMLTRCGNDAKLLYDIAVYLHTVLAASLPKRNLVQWACERFEHINHSMYAPLVVRFRSPAAYVALTFAVSLMESVLWHEPSTVNIMGIVSMAMVSQSCVSARLTGGIGVYRTGVPPGTTRDRFDSAVREGKYAAVIAALYDSADHVVCTAKPARRTVHVNGAVHEHRPIYDLVRSIIGEIVAHPYNVPNEARLTGPCAVLISIVNNTCACAHHPVRAIVPSDGADIIQPLVSGYHATP
jgi:hypothetical protein